MTCIKERQRLIERNTKPYERLTTMMYRGRLFFAEKVRRPIKRGNVLVMDQTNEPITTFDENDPWWSIRLNKRLRDIDDAERMLKVFDEQQAEYEARVQEIGDSFEEELKAAIKDEKIFDVGSIKERK